MLGTMTAPPPHEASFVARIWWEYPGSGAPVFRGRAERVITGQTTYFDSAHALASFLCERPGSFVEPA
jgi:hypothetical protein